MPERSDMVKFTVPGNPQGKARAKTVRNRYTGKVNSFTPEKTLLYENLITEIFETASHERWMNGEPLKVSIVAFYPIPKSTSNNKKTLMLAGQLRPTKKPDADNVAKVICDALNGIAYHDDTQVVELTVHKYFGEVPKVRVQIQEV